MSENDIKLLLPLPEPILNRRTTTHPHHDGERQYKIQLNAIKPFQTLKPDQIYFIHDTIPIVVIQNLMQCADKTKTFSIVAERYHNRIVYITIEFLQLQHLKSIVLVFPILKLPPANTNSSFMIHMLIQSIFVPSKTFYVWDNDHLNIMELNELFKWWYNTTFKHSDKCPTVPSLDQSDSRLCTCRYRPYKDTSMKWTIDMAIEYVFNEFIDTTNKDTSILTHGIDMTAAANYCSAIYKLAMVIELNWTLEQLCQYKRYHQE